MYLIIMEGSCGGIDADDSICHGYYIIKISSSPYTFQADLIIYGEVNHYFEMVSESNLFLPNQYQSSLLCFQIKKPTIQLHL